VGLSRAARIRLFNIFLSDFYYPRTTVVQGQKMLSGPATEFLLGAWTEFCMGRLDQYPGSDKFVFQIIGTWLESGHWHLMLDIWEELFEHRDLLPHPEKTACAVREAMERENTAYTFVGGRFVERMTPQEVKSVETALKTPIEGVKVHLTDALQKLSDRENPDFRNSIKESIIAVEAACKHLAGSRKGDLNVALDKLNAQRPLHPALKNAFSTLYGWTSDDRGIRHAIKDAENVERADAQFMLVACSAFVNYLMTR